MAADGSASSSRSLPAAAAAAASSSAAASAMACRMLVRGHNVAGGCRCAAAPGLRVWTGGGRRAAVSVPVAAGDGEAGGRLPPCRRLPTSSMLPRDRLAGPGRCRAARAASLGACIEEVPPACSPGPRSNCRRARAHLVAPGKAAGWAGAGATGAREVLPARAGGGRLRRCAEETSGGLRGGWAWRRESGEPARGEVPPA